MRLIESSNLIGIRLAQFQSSIRDDFDKMTVFQSLSSQLSGKKYWVSVADSARSCGQTWFGRDETFIFFDESQSTSLQVVRTFIGTRPVILNLNLDGNIRYMIAVRAESTCIYRVDVDVQNFFNDIPRPSDSASVTVRSIPAPRSTFQHQSACKTPN